MFCLRLLVRETRDTRRAFGDALLFQWSTDTPVFDEKKKHARVDALVASQMAALAMRRLARVAERLRAGIRTPPATCPWRRVTGVGPWTRPSLTRTP